jgi:hypothetical protein
MKLPHGMTELPAGGYIESILHGRKYNGTTLGDLIDEGLVPYMVHGDGVQAMKRTLHGALSR